MTDTAPPEPVPEPPIPAAPVTVPGLPRPGVLLFAAAFAAAMLFNLIYDATHAEYSGERLTIFLGTATLLILGVDIGKMIGRR